MDLQIKNDLVTERGDSAGHLDRHTQKFSKLQDSKLVQALNIMIGFKILPDANKELEISNHGFKTI